MNPLLNIAISSKLPDDAIPRQVVEDSRYCVRFARDAADVDAALKLRFEVFNLELGEGLDQSFDTFRDEDEFDRQCHHLLVIDRGTQTVIGTYRLQTSEMAGAGRGFYSAGEYVLNTMPPDVYSQAVEVGRACIAREHRNKRVLFLLWRGLALYVKHTRKRYLFGCCSVSTQDLLQAMYVKNYLANNGFNHPHIWVLPHPETECFPTNFSSPETKEIEIPRLFRTYLKFGAKICSPPAIDRAFKTIDFLVIMDIAQMSDSNYRMFFE